MKNLIVTTAIVLFLTTFFSSCKTLVPYTTDLEKRYGLKDHREKIQFYSSEEMELQRVLDSTSVYLTHGKIKTVGDKEVEFVKIKRRTKGGKLYEEGQKIKVGFEKSDEYYLSFGPNPQVGNKFVVLAEKWVAGIGYVHYGTEEYSLTKGKTCYLMVNLKKIQNLNKKSRIAKGRKVK